MDCLLLRFFLVLSSTPHLALFCFLLVLARRFGLVYGWRGNVVRFSSIINCRFNSIINWDVNMRPLTRR